jgi:DNA invertase Pin-like site-specific DNA recombinase
MKPGTYARYSSDLQRQASIEDQQRRCCAEITRRGWPSPQHFADSEIAGSVARGRPGYQALLAAARSGEINVIIVDELSRLTRDPEELAGLRKRLKFWGCHLVALLDGVDTVNSPAAAAAVMLLGAYRNEAETEATAFRTHRGLQGRVLKGMHAGGAIYGYRTRPVHTDRPGDPPGTGEVIGYEYLIHEAEADVIRSIFEWYAGGLSCRAIAHRLNERGIPSPGRRWRDGRHLRGTWCHSAIQGWADARTGLLNNEKYIGRLIWNRTHRPRDPERDGKKTLRLARADEWTVVEAPDLRIVPQELWERVKARQHARSCAGNGTKAVAKTIRLLSGFLKCSKCGGALTIRGACTYRCAARYDRGQAVCDSVVSVNAAHAETAVLSFLGECLSADRIVERAMALSKERRRSRTQPTSQRDDLLREIAQVEAEAARLVEALGRGLLVSQIEGRMRQIEARLSALRVQLIEANAEALAPPMPIMPAALRATAANLREAADAGDIEALKRGMRLIVERIEVRERRREGQKPPDVHLDVALTAGMRAMLGLPNLTSVYAQDPSWTLVRLPRVVSGRIEVGLLIESFGRNG